jgi:hypothetical protein
LTSKPPSKFGERELVQQSEHQAFSEVERFACVSLAFLHPDEHRLTEVPSHLNQFRRGRLLFQDHPNIQLQAIIDLNKKLVHSFHAIINQYL